MSTSIDEPQLPEPRTSSRAVPINRRRRTRLAVVGLALIAAVAAAALVAAMDKGDSTAASTGVTTQPVDVVTTTVPVQPAVVIAADAEWRYWFTGDGPGDFSNPAYDDTGWDEGRGPFGLGESALGTVLLPGPPPEPITAYFRRVVTLTADEINRDIRITVVRDDGVAVFVNGVEVLRDNLPAGALTAESFAVTDVYGEGETTPIEVVLPANTLVVGDNVFAVEVHQNFRASPDLFMELTASFVER